MSADSKKSVDDLALAYANRVSDIEHESFDHRQFGFKAGFQARDAELLICPACGTEGYRQDIKPCSDSIRVDLKLMGDKIKLLTDALSIAEEALRHRYSDININIKALNKIVELRKEMEGG